MICPRCHKQIPDNTYRCSECGFVFTDYNTRYREGKKGKTRKATNVNDFSSQSPKPSKPESEKFKLLDLFKAQKYKKEIDALKLENEKLKDKMTSIGCDEYFQTQEKIALLEANASEEMAKLLEEVENRKQTIDSEIQQANKDITECNEIILKLRSEISNSKEEYEKLQKQNISQLRKLQRTKELYKSIDYCITTFLSDDYSKNTLSADQTCEYDEFAPSVILNLHCMDMRDLRKAYRDNDKQIEKILKIYSSRYTTKANQSIYQLMVIALRAELQNILFNLKYEKLDQSIDNVKNVTAKYLKIAGNGNQNIAGTLTKFIGEIEYLFINAVKIEYNYYVKKEQSKQEQLAIREQMRQEAEERRALEFEKKRVEKEESKYSTEIEKLKESLSNAENNDETTKLRERILELQAQLSSVIVKKEEIVNLQNGKAGNVYIISNLGSFGDNIFKIGMTRRIDPQDRINELGSASVPFKFDVHSFIFSQDAVGLENKLHNILNDKRLNKVNLRKEFFKVPIDDLENIVMQIEPTAEFKKTMLAEEFRQSLSSDKIYTTDYNVDDLFDEDMDD